MLVAFALEPATALPAAAQRKLERKGVDAIVANPLDTMEAPRVSATLLWRDGRAAETAPAKLGKAAFATWLLDRLLPVASERAGVGRWRG
jgi:phosphopantothenoylcysteine synthetase/decarboxylase